MDKRFTNVQIIMSTLENHRLKSLQASLLLIRTLYPLEGDISPLKNKSPLQILLLEISLIVRFICVYFAYMYMYEQNLQITHLSFVLLINLFNYKLVIVSYNNNTLQLVPFTKSFTYFIMY